MLLARESIEWRTQLVLNRTLSLFVELIYQLGRSTLMNFIANLVARSTLIEQKGVTTFFMLASNKDVFPSIQLES